MEPPLETLVNELASACPEAALSKGNWESLYLLSVYVHSQGRVVDITKVKKLLIDRGCSIHRAGFFCRQIESFCRLLTVYDEEKSTGAPS
jgi:hypothetical protein